MKSEIYDICFRIFLPELSPDEKLFREKLISDFIKLGDRAEIMAKIISNCFIYERSNGSSRQCPICNGFITTSLKSHLDKAHPYAQNLNNVMGLKT